MKRTVLVVLLAVVAVGFFISDVLAVEPEFVKEFQIGDWKPRQISISEDVEPLAYEVAEELRQYPAEQYDVSCEVIGRANKTGTFAENEVISDGRANNIASFLRANVLGIKVYPRAAGQQADVMRVDVRCKFYPIPVAPVKEEVKQPETQRKELSYEEQQELARGILEQLRAVQKEQEKPVETVLADTKIEATNIAKVAIGLSLLAFAGAVIVAFNARKAMKKRKSPKDVSIGEAVAETAEHPKEVVGKERRTVVKKDETDADGKIINSVYYTVLIIEMPDGSCLLPFTDADGKSEVRPSYQVAKSRARECIFFKPEYKAEVEALLHEGTRLFEGLGPKV